MAYKKLTKAEEKLLRDYAAQMPIVMDETIEKHIMTGAEIMEMGHVDIVDGIYKNVKLEPEKKYMYDMPVQLASNHYRRLKLAWFKDGEKGISAYINKILDIIHQNKTVNAGV